METFKLSNRMFGSARMVTVSFPVSNNEVESFVNANETTGKWVVTGRDSDWCSDYQEGYDHALEMEFEGK